LPDRVRLVVLFGGRSAEHDISCVSASHVLRAADPHRYDLVPVAITREGGWQLAEGAARLLGEGRRAELPEALGVDGPRTDPFEVFGAVAADDPAPPTVVLPMLHGPNGEDGTVQGLLELAGVPYVGTGVLGSALAMDKAMAKTVLGAAGIPQVPWRELRRTQLGEPDLATALLDELGSPLFVKPANMGSSIGVSKVRDAAGLDAALRLAADYDEVLVVEAGVEGRELECAVLGNDRPRASVVGEILPTADFYDYEDKYLAGSSQQVVPAELPDDVSDAARALALAAYAALRAEGMARVDLFLCERDGGAELLVNEVNTIPGFTPISMYPMLWRASGLSSSGLLDELVALALERHERRSMRRTDHPGRERS
jgi:D-alanine-D-alanine ligase